MAEIERTEGRVQVDYMARDYDSFLRSMRELVPEKLPEWTEYESEADFGNVLLQLFAHMGDILSYYQDRVANESFLGTARTRRSIIHHLRLIGYQLSTAAPASTELAISLPADCEEVVVLRRGDAFTTKSTRDVPSVRFEYAEEEDLTVDCGELPAVAGRKVIEGVPVEEGRLVEDELLGTSDGAPNQRFSLAHARLILRSLGREQGTSRDIILRTELGGVVTEWRLVETLAFSRAGETDFTVEIDQDDRATILFGDGDFGAVPEPGAAVRATYRVGGGGHGNVPRGSIETLADAPQLSLLAAEVTNPEAASGGADRETIEHAVRHAPSVFRSLRRAVTAQDYEALALDFSGVGKVRADAASWNTVTLHVAPEGGGRVSDVLRASLLAYFEGLRPLSTLIRVEDVDYVEIFVTAEVSVVSYYSQEKVAEEVRQAGGALLAFETVDFRKPIYLSKFYEAIEDIEGVAFVNIREFRREGGPVPDGVDPSRHVEPSGKIELEEYELAVAAEAYDGRIRVIPSGGF